MWRNSDAIIILTGLTLLLYGTAMGIQYMWRRLVFSSRKTVTKIKNSPLWFNYIRIPMQWLTYPVRRFHRRYTDRVLRTKMAKWEERVIADKILDVLYAEVEAGRISKARFRRMQTEMGNFFNIPDLIRRKTDRDAVKRRLMANKEYQIGPKPGAKLVPNP